MNLCIFRNSEKSIDGRQVTTCARTLSNHQLKHVTGIVWFVEVVNSVMFLFGVLCNHKHSLYCFYVGYFSFAESYRLLYDSRMIDR